MAFHPRGIVTLTDCVVSLWIGIMRASIAHIVCGWFLATCTRYAVMPRGASGFSGSVNSSPTYSRRFDDPLFDLTREAILRAFRSMVTLRLFAHVEFTSRNMFDVCHWFPKRSDDSRTRASVTALMEALAAIESQIARLDEQLRELARRSPLCWRLMSVPGVGSDRGAGFHGGTARRRLGRSRHARRRQIGSTGVVNRPLALQLTLLRRRPGCRYAMRACPGQ